MLPEIMRDVSSQHRDWIDRIVLIGYDSKGNRRFSSTYSYNFEKIQEWSVWWTVR